MTSPVYCRCGKHPTREHVLRAQLLLQDTNPESRAVVKLSERIAEGRVPTYRELVGMCGIGA